MLKDSPHPHCSAEVGVSHVLKVEPETIEAKTY